MNNEILSIFQNQDISLSEIAQHIDKPEWWILSALSGRQHFTFEELESIASELDLEPKVLDGLLNVSAVQDENTFSKLMWLVLDKIIIGFIVLGIATLVQIEYQNFLAEQNKVISASTLKSDYIKQSHNKLQTSFLSLLSNGDELIIYLEDAGNNKEVKNELLGAVLKSQSEIMLYIDILMVTDDFSEALEIGNIFKKTIVKFTKRLKSFSPNEDTESARKELPDEYVAVSEKIQQLLIKVSVEEVSDVI